MTGTDWTFGTSADDTTEPYELVDARCSCGWRSKPTTGERAARLAAAHRRRWDDAAARGEVQRIEHATSVGPVELHGDHLAAEPLTRPDPCPFGRRYRLALAQLVMSAAALLVVAVIDRRATVQTSVSTYTVERHA